MMISSTVKTSARMLKRCSSNTNKSLSPSNSLRSFSQCSATSTSRVNSQESVWSTPSLLNSSRSSSGARTTSAFSSMSLRRSSSSLYLQGLSSASLQAEEQRHPHEVQPVAKVNEFDNPSPKTKSRENRHRMERHINVQDSVQQGSWIPTWIQNGIIFFGLYHQSFVVIIMMYLVQSVVVQFPTLDTLIDYKCWLPFLAPSSISTGNEQSRQETLENIQQFYMEYKTRSNDSLNSYDGHNSGPVSSGMKKSTSDEWGHFTDFDEQFLDLNDPIVPASVSTKANNSSINNNVQLGTLHELDNEDEH